LFFDINASLLNRQRKNLKASDFSSILSADIVTEELRKLNLSFRTRIFTPFVTLYTFLAQVINDDRSCRKVLLELSAISKLLSRVRPSINSGSYVKAKARLPLALIKSLVRRLGTNLQETRVWRHGRVLVVDGTGVSMPETMTNLKVFPHHSGKDFGFPVARILAVFSLSTGAMIDMIVGPWKGKGTGELTLLKKLWHVVKSGDTLVGDSLFSSFSVIAGVLQNDCHLVSEFRISRCWRLNSRIGDQIIEIEKPAKRPDYISESEFKDWPQKVRVRIVKLVCAPKGFRPKVKYILTTHLDKDVVSSAEILDLYRRRWQVELNLRSIKTVLGMDILTGKSPEMAVKEIWMFFLAYNLIREKMVEAAIIKDTPVQMISFRSTHQMMNIIKFANSFGKLNQPGLNHDFLKLIGTQVVGKRPNRYEPRVIKRRKKNFTLLSVARSVAKKKLYKKWK